VANVLFNYNMFLLHRDAKYMDVMEVGLFNTVLAGVNLDGNRFFYQNPLESNGSHNRSPWHGCACCPTNIARVVPRVPGYFYALAGDEIYVSLFATSKTEITISSGKIGLDMESDYPWSGDIKLTVAPEKAMGFTIKLRIPGWARNEFLPAGLYHFVEQQPETWSVAVNGQVVDCALDKGYAVVKRTWQPGDIVDLHLPMPVRLVKSNDKVEANINRVAITRGPIVYCAEGVDNGGDVQRFFVPKTAKLQYAYNGDLLNGCVTVTIDGAKELDIADGKIVETDARVMMAPYALWNNRGADSMNVWMAECRETLRQNVLFEARLRAPHIKNVEASFTCSRDTVVAIIDGKEPSNSHDDTIPRWTSFPQGNSQSVTITFTKPLTLDSVGVYWYDDGPGRGVRVPESWKVRVKRDGRWKLFHTKSDNAYGTGKDTYNTVYAKVPVTCDAILIKVDARQGKSVGILDVKLGFE